MSHTTFRFDLRLLSEDPLSTLAEIKSLLEAVKGIKDVKFCVAGDVAEMRVELAFADKDGGIALNRKIMKVVIANPGIRIQQASSILTDIF